MLNPGLSALWKEEDNRRKLLKIDAPLETPDLEGKCFFIYSNYSFWSKNNLLLERTNVLKIENEIEFKQKLISLLEKR